MDERPSTVVPGNPATPTRFTRARVGLVHYFALTYLVVLALTASYVTFTSDAGAAVYSIVLYLTYSFIYLIPAIAVTWLAWLFLIRLRSAAPGRGRVAAVLAIAVTMTALTTLILYSDRVVFRTFGFHFNGFVWNLIVTPGGIKSMGAGNDTVVTTAAIALGFVLLQVVLARVIGGRAVPSLLDRFLTRRTRIVLLIAFVVGTLGERVAYAVSALRAYSPILSTVEHYPFYLRLSLRSVAKKLGIEAVQDDELDVDVEHGRLTYPLQPLVVEKPARPLNIVWLTAESLRADMLDPEIMPETWAFAQDSWKFTHHYSGGKGTRMGMFAQFYSLHGSYWFSFLREHRGTVLFDVLKPQGYQLAMYTSANFSYPEFDKTIFAELPPEQLHECDVGEGWENDRCNVASLTQFIHARDPSRPFMTFMFFESPHARYNFPSEAVIRTPYLESMNYATMDVERDIVLIKNRYINAVHHLDQQLGRVFAALKAEGVLDQTIVIINGDHGEEFMEKGRWGHNSAFTEEQTRTPLVLHIPGMGARVIDAMTSHLDILPTVMARLGVKNDPADYGFGEDLTGEIKRDYVIIGDWDKLCYVDSGFKEAFGFLPGTFVNAPPPATDANDKVLDDPKPLRRERTARLVDVMHQMGRFLGRP